MLKTLSLFVMIIFRVKFDVGLGLDGLLILKVDTKEEK